MVYSRASPSTLLRGHPEKDVNREERGGIMRDGVVTILFEINV